VSPESTPPRPTDPLSLCVVIPTLDEEEHVAARVRRLLAAADVRDRADRVVVVDGGSADRTRELALRAGAEVRRAARGRGTQLAAGAEGATETLLLFLHADNAPAAGALAAVRRAFADPELGYAGLRQRIDAAGRFYRLVERAADARVRRGMVYGDSGLACRRTLYERVGGFAAVPLFEDVDLSRRLRRAGRWACIAEAELRISARRWRAGGPLRTTLRNWMLRLAHAGGMRPERLARWYAPHAAAAGSAERASR